MKKLLIVLLTLLLTCSGYVFVKDAKAAYNPGDGFSLTVSTDTTDDENASFDYYVRFYKEAYVIRLM